MRGASRAARGFASYIQRAAAENDNDTTDYTLSSTARAFVLYYSQRMCTAIRMHGAQGILMRISQSRPPRPTPHSASPRVSRLGEERACALLLHSRHVSALAERLQTNGPP